MHLFTLNEHSNGSCDCRIMLDTSSCTVVFPDKEPVRITDMEARILLELMRAKGAPVSKDALIRKVWDGYASNDALAHKIQALRKKLGEGTVLAVYGYGYRINI